MKKRNLNRNTRGMAILMALAIVLAMLPVAAMADCGEYVKTYFYAEDLPFTLDNAGYIVGKKASDEPEARKVLVDQKYCGLCPNGITERGPIRHKAGLEVWLVEETAQFTKGVSYLYASFSMDSGWMKQVAEVLGVEAEEVTAELLANGLIEIETSSYVDGFFGEQKALAYTRFFTSDTDRVRVGTVAFLNGSTAEVYLGHWGYCGCLKLGLAPGWYDAERIEVETEEEHGYETVTVTYVREYDRTKVITRTYRNEVLVNEETTYEYDHQGQWYPVSEQEHSWCTDKDPQTPDTW